MKIAIIGTYPPRQCGIATFTHDLFKSMQAIDNTAPSVIAISDGSEPPFPNEVSFIIEKDNIDSYLQATQYINTTYDAVIIQHEYGIFGGGTGNYILDLAQKLSVPIVTNFHTVLQHPNKEEYRVLRKLAACSQRITVMTQTAVYMLEDIYKIPAAKITLIPHGVPHFKDNQQSAKRKLGLSNKKIMLSFGFLGPSKGFETAIEAVAHIPNDDFVYIILGSTHPNILREAGDSYRQSLQTKAQQLGVTSKVCFVNEFVSEGLLTQYLSACDIYVTPYPNENQISSGTLTFAIGAGAAVISTPYWYAKDLLKDDRGLLFDFKDSRGLARQVNTLLENSSLLAQYRRNAAQYGKSMSWTNIGKLQQQLLKGLIRQKKSYSPLSLTVNDIQDNIHNFLQKSSPKLSVYKRDHKRIWKKMKQAMPQPKQALQQREMLFEVDMLQELIPAFPDLDLSHIMRLTNTVSIIQHATYSVPNYKHGYCLDDTARALLLVTMAAAIDSKPVYNKLSYTYLAYIHYMQLESGKFRNFLSYDHQFMDECGTEDSFGRTLWALGFFLQHTEEQPLILLAQEMFRKAVSHCIHLQSVRAVGYALLGLQHYYAFQPEDEEIRDYIHTLTHYLLDEYEHSSSDSWRWYEQILAYDNAIIPLAVLRSRFTMNISKVQDIGLQTAQYLDKLIFEKGFLSTIGNINWYLKGAVRGIFAQQPIEVPSTLLLYKELYDMTGDLTYKQRMLESFQWFLGKNELGLQLYDPHTKGCCDGLERHGVNLNQGAESTISFWQAYLFLCYRFD